MEQLPLETNESIISKLDEYSDMVYRICYIYLHNNADIEDVFQEVFLKLLQAKKAFESVEHEKAWLIRVTINMCKDILKSFWKKRVDFVDEIELPYKDTDADELLQIVLSLPPKYKEAIYLYYYEEYTVPQIAKFTNKTENTIYSHLHRARMLIKNELEGQEHENSFSIIAESH